MKNIVHLPIMAALAAVLALPSCTKDELVTPKTESSPSQSADGTLQLFRWGEENSYNFPGQESYLPNLTNIPAVNGTVMTVPMVRKNLIYAANGDKYLSQWESIGSLNPANYPVTFPYKWQGYYTETDGRLYAITFSIDEFGLAKATLTWNNK